MEYNINIIVSIQRKFRHRLNAKLQRRYMMMRYNKILYYFKPMIILYTLDNSISYRCRKNNRCFLIDLKNRLDYTKHNERTDDYSMDETQNKIYNEYINKNIIYKNDIINFAKTLDICQVRYL